MNPAVIKFNFDGQLTHLAILETCTTAVCNYLTLTLQGATQYLGLLNMVDFPKLSSSIYK